jgi:hypothetical protein
VIRSSLSPQESPAGMTYHSNDLVHLRSCGEGRPSSPLVSFWGACRVADVIGLKDDNIKSWSTIMSGDSVV